MSSRTFQCLKNILPGLKSLKYDIHSEVSILMTYTRDSSTAFLDSTYSGEHCQLRGPRKVTSLRKCQQKPTGYCILALASHSASLNHSFLFLKGEMIQRLVKFLAVLYNSPLLHHGLVNLSNLEPC